jgi:multidrug efflux pump subunit AcrA (membrane-fusion protein)
MTNNQISFYRAREEARHNKSVEGETARHDIAQEALGYGQLSETKRHNVQTEDLNWYTGESTVQLQGAQTNTEVARLSNVIADTDLKEAQEQVANSQKELNQALAVLRAAEASAVTEGSWYEKNQITVQIQELERKQEELKLAQERNDWERATAIAKAISEFIKAINGLRSSNGTFRFYK